MSYHLEQNVRSDTASPAASGADGFSLTARLATLSPREALLSVRGFTAKNPGAKKCLEEAGSSFIAGYNSALTGRLSAVLPAGLGSVEPERSGFFIEGAAMGCGVRDAMPWHTFAAPVLPRLLAASSQRNPYLPTVGAGWAMARLRWRRKAILRCLDRLLAPLAFDGWGFHDCYFNPKMLARGPGDRIAGSVGGVARNAWDQGAGRAAWFICGGDIDEACARIARTDPSRHGNLFAGLGLAVTYAGGVDADACRRLRLATGPEGRHLAQGSAFGLVAHHDASTDTAQIRERAAALTGVVPETVVAIVRSAMPISLGQPMQDFGDSSRLYEQWRSRIATNLDTATESHR